MAELDNTLKVKATFTDEGVKQGTEEIKKEIEDVSTVSKELAPSLETAKSSVLGLSAAENEAAIAAASHKNALAAVSFSAQQAAAAVQEMELAAATGGKVYAAAIAFASAAVTKLRAAIAAMPASAVPPEYVAQLATLTAQLEAAVLSQDRLTKSTVNFKGFANIAQGSIGGLARAMAQATKDGAGLLGPLARMALPILAIVEGTKLAVMMFQQWNKVTKDLSDKFVDWIEGINKADEAVGSLSAKMDTYKARVADIRQQQILAQYAVIQGLIEEGNTLEATTRNWIAYQAGIHGVIQEGSLADETFKKLGVTFRDLDVKARTFQFMQAVQKALKDGAGAARAFGEDNQHVVQELVDAWIWSGQQMDPVFKAYADSLGVISKKQKELNEETKKAQKVAEQQAKDNELLSKDLKKVNDLMEDETKDLKALTEARKKDIEQVEKQLKQDIGAPPTVLTVAGGADIDQIRASQKAYEEWQGRRVEAKREAETKIDKINQEFGDREREVLTEHEAKIKNLIVAASKLAPAFKWNEIVASVDRTNEAALRLDGTLKSVAASAAAVNAQGRQMDAGGGGGEGIEITSSETLPANAEGPPIGGPGGGPPEPLY